MIWWIRTTVASQPFRQIVRRKLRVAALSPSLSPNPRSRRLRTSSSRFASSTPCLPARDSRLRCKTCGSETKEIAGRLSIGRPARCLPGDPKGPIHHQPTLRSFSCKRTGSSGLELLRTQCGSVGADCCSTPKKCPLPPCVQRFPFFNPTPPPLFTSYALQKAQRFQPAPHEIVIPSSSSFVAVMRAWGVRPNIAWVLIVALLFVWISRPSGE